MRPLLAVLLVLAACSRDAELPEGVPADLDPLIRARIEAALAACRRGDPGAQLELAKTYDANGLGDLALPAYERVLAADLPSAERVELEYLRAQVLETLGRPEEALAGFDAALALGDEHGPTWWSRGNLLLDLGRLDEARAAFERAHALEPHSVPALLGLARVHLLQEDPAAARAVLEPLAEREPGERFVHGLLARALGALGETDRARVELAREARAKRVSFSDPRRAAVRTRTTGFLAELERADELMLDGQARAAVEVLEPLRALRPDDLAVLQLLGKALTLAAEHDRSIALLTEACRAHPAQFLLELRLGQALDAKRAYREALAHMETAHALNPVYVPTLAALGEVRMKLAQHAAAEDALARALEAGEDGLRTRVMLAQVQLEQQAWGRARATAEAACTAYPNAVAAWTYLAEARARGGDPESARAALAEAERRNPDYERLALVRGLLAEGDAPR
jgi:tetratricopeptide (TPR) repeat protein